MLKLSVFDFNKFIDVNSNIMREVVDPIFFDRDNIPTPEGLFSYQLFGTTPRERKKYWGYIDLKIKFINPAIYITFKKLIPTLIDGIISGTMKVSIDKDGYLYQDKENGETGITWFYENFEKIKYKDTGTDSRDVSLKVLSKLKKNEIFIDKFLVIPPFYRDMNFSNNKVAVDEINNHYADILKRVKILDQDSEFSFLSNRTKYGIQNSLNEIHKYFLKDELARRKYGKLRKYLMGKNVTNGARLVISSPRYYLNDMQKNPINFYHTGVPLGILCSLFYPFVYKWVMEFFDNKLLNQKVSWATTSGDIRVLDDIRGNFNSKWVEKTIKAFIKSPGSRFNKIEIINDKKETLYLYMKLNDGTKDILRPMSICDLLYQACEEVCRDKHIVVTRYPLTEYSGVYTSKIHVMSTLDTEKIILDGRVYEHYPKIDYTKSQDKISISFIDTLIMSNLYLSVMGADYDGDQVSVRGLWTQEANKNCEKNMTSLKSIVDINGNIYRTTTRETLQTFYNLSKGILQIQKNN